MYTPTRCFCCNLLLCIVSIAFEFDSIKELKVKTICCLVAWDQGDLSVQWNTKCGCCRSDKCYIYERCLCIQVLSIHVDTKIPENNVNIIVFPIITIKLYSCL